jgi:hypothetical protein
VNSRQKNFKCRSIARGFKLVTWESGSVKDANKLCFFTRSCITHFVLRYKRIWYNTTTTHYMKRTTVKRHHLPQHTTTGARNQHWTTCYAHHPSDLPPTTAKEASKANLRKTPPLGTLKPRQHPQQGSRYQRRRHCRHRQGRAKLTLGTMGPHPAYKGCTTSPNGAKMQRRLTATPTAIVETVDADT